MSGLRTPDDVLNNIESLEEYLLRSSAAGVTSVAGGRQASIGFVYKNATKADVLEPLPSPRPLPRAECIMRCEIAECTPSLDGRFEKYPVEPARASAGRVVQAWTGRTPTSCCRSIKAELRKILLGCFCQCLCHAGFRE